MGVVIYLFIFCTTILFTLINGNHVQVYKPIEIQFPFPDTKYLHEFIITCTFTSQLRHLMYTNSTDIQCNIIH